MKSRGHSSVPKLIFTTTTRSRCSFVAYCFRVILFLVRACSRFFFTFSVPISEFFACVPRDILADLLAHRVLRWSSAGELHCSDMREFLYTKALIKITTQFAFRQRWMQWSTMHGIARKLNTACQKHQLKAFLQLKTNIFSTSKHKNKCFEGKPHRHNLSL